MRSFWDALYVAVGHGGATGCRLVLRALPMKLPEDSCPLSPGPVALEVSLDGEVIAHAIKPICLITGKSRNKLEIKWAVRSFA